MSGEVSLEAKVKDEVSSRTVSERQEYVRKQFKLKETKRARKETKTDSYLLAIMDYLPTEHEFLKRKEETKVVKDEYTKREEERMYDASLFKDTVYVQPQLPVDERFADMVSRYSPGTSAFELTGQKSVFSIDIVKGFQLN